MDLIEQPRCPNCGVVMRDEPGAYRCPACGRVIEVADVPPAPVFDGPAIHGG
ncbi:TFIIB-type zinc ribbon-containing protein [Microbacterium sp. ABRD28]|uniref:TFIIB-type zinc ribbon-containing protein n=1 Tax=Microbacterium sp. ABRD28 TaxID=2268461 RepID=UPI0013DE24F0|nr:TFIIB-type zinc ribbon-containing protein [Microbacterium sp. ABRD28]